MQNPIGPQVAHGIKQALVIMAIAALTALGADLTGILDQIGVDDVYVPVAFAAIGAAVRILESKRDSNRATDGRMVPADVGYEVMEELAADDAVPAVQMLPDESIVIQQPVLPEAPRAVV
jgi:hypothetical protein